MNASIGEVYQASQTKLGDKFAVCTQTGLLEFTNQLQEVNWYPYPQWPGPDTNRLAFEVCFYDSRGDLWVFNVEDDPYYKLDRDRGQLVPGIKGLLVNGEPRNALLFWESRDGSTWFLSNGWGLFHFNFGTLKFQSPPNLIVPGNYRAVYKLPDGSLLGNIKGRLNFKKDLSLPPEKLIQQIEIPQSDIKNGFEYHDFLLEKRSEGADRLWIAIRKTPLAYEIGPDGNLIFQKDPHPENHQTGYEQQRLMLDSAGKLYSLGTSQLTVYDSSLSGFRELLHFPPEERQYMYVQCALHLAPDGQIWFGNENGLTRYDPNSGNSQSYSHQNSDLHPDEHCGRSGST